MIDNFMQIAKYYTNLVLGIYVKQNKPDKNH
jgi:hypothetical protein